jgi:plasmid maintenance system killer protein
VLVEFRSSRLRICYEKSEKATREWGDKVGRRYIERVNVLKHARSVDDLYRMPPLAFHPLKGGRRGFYALTVIDRWRMVVSFVDQEMTIVRIEEVSAHYGD